MSTKDLGKKLTCQSCHAKFYDLKKKGIACPKCEAEYVAEKPKPRRAAPKAAVAKEAPADNADASATEVKPKSEEVTESGDKIESIEDIEVDDSDDDGEDDTTLIEDTSEIGGDEEDIAGVAANVVGENGDKDS